MQRFACILADPPWPFEDQGSRIAPAHAGHYDVMSMAAILGLGDFVAAVAADNAHLWLCTPNALLLDGSALAVAKAWSFKPRQILTWCKPTIGMGHWLRNSTEQIVFCTRGTLAALARNVPTHFEALRGRHSEKPAALYAVAEAVSPGPRLEMFARAPRRGWRSYGDEAPQATRIGA